MQNFKTESKRLMELMVNSIYTNKEIFLRELISNASDALEKLHFISLTTPGLPADFAIEITIDKPGRRLILSDNGVGMNKEDLEENLGTIAKSGTLALKQAEKADAAALIGQFGVGFYSTFMVASKVEVLSRRYDSETAYLWTSEGIEGYDIAEAAKPEAGTTITLYLKENDEDYSYDNLLEEYQIKELVRKYSDYIRFPIRMETDNSREGEDGKWETVREITTLNSMVPIWKKAKSDVTEQEYNEFYKNKFFDFTDPIKTIVANIEGTVSYSLIAFVPQKAPYDFYSKDFEKGMTLYSNSVLIMQKCSELLPDYLGFLRGIVDSGDLSLNISREILQQDSQLKAIANSLEKKILSEFSKFLKNDRENYEKFFSEFGLSLKGGAYAEYGRNKDKLKDLLLFKSSFEEKYTTLAEYAGRLKEGQEFIYYSAGNSVTAIKKTPQVMAVTGKGFEVLYFDEPMDEFLVKVLEEYSGKKFKSVSSGDILQDSAEDKAQMKKAAKESADLLKEMKAHLKGKVKDVILSKASASFPTCIRAEGEVSLEMEKLLNSMPGASKQIKTQRILEVNPEHPLFARVKDYFQNDKPAFESLTDLIHQQALLLANIALDDNAAFIELTNTLLTK